MYSVYCKKIIVATLVSVLNLPITLLGQKYGIENRNFSSFNRKPYYFGLTLGLNSSSFKVNQSKNFIGNDSISIVEGARTGGFNLHMIANLKMGDYFDFRFLPGFAFANRSIEYTKPAENKPYVQRIEAVFFELPFHLRYKSSPYKDKRFFIIGGLKYSYDVASNSKSRRAVEILKISPHDFQFELGFGLQMFYPYFIFSPEIKFSRGLNNLLLYNRDLNQSRVLENVVSQFVTISFHFEG